MFLECLCGNLIRRDMKLFHRSRQRLIHALDANSMSAQTLDRRSQRRRYVIGRWHSLRFGSKSRVVDDARAPGYRVQKINDIIVSARLDIVGSFGPGLRIGLAGAVTLMAVVAALIWLAGGLGTGIR